jgi:cytochrome c
VRGLPGIVSIGFISALAVAARAQIPLPSAPAPQDGATLFRNQCATCHTLDPADPPRMGPLLKGVVGRKAGSFPGFKYTAGFAQADWTWDAARLDAWLTNPQAMIPGTIMVFRQANADTRHRIIAYLGEQQ